MAGDTFFQRLMGVVSLGGSHPLTPPKKNLNLDHTFSPTLKFFYTHLNTKKNFKCLIGLTFVSLIIWWVIKFSFFVVYVFLKLVHPLFLQGVSLYPPFYLSLTLFHLLCLMISEIGTRLIQWSTGCGISSSKILTPTRS